jgi:hypothetical protein
MEDEACRGAWLYRDMNVASVKCVPATVPATKNLLEVDPSKPVIFECDQGGKFVVRIVGITWRRREDH